jgi:hypothetical protein
MQRVRTGRTGRIVAVFFLLWTAVDLVNPGVCAIDEHPDSRTARPEAASLSTAGRTQQQTPGGAGEDCFCCCHHIVSTPLWAPLPQPDLIQSVIVPPVEQVRVLHARLDHPPRLA